MASNWFIEQMGPYLGTAVFTIIMIVCIILPLLLAVAYLTYAERKVMAAMQIRRGMQRQLIEMRHVTLPELSLRSGRRADIVTLSVKGEIWIIEIKSSIEDFRVDRKWPDYRLHSDRFFFATHPAVPSEIFPAECGFILSDGYGAEIMREAPEHRMAAATRKALMLRIARAGAARLLAAELAGVPVPALEGESE